MILLSFVLNNFSSGNSNDQAQLDYFILVYSLILLSRRAQGDVMLTESKF